MDLKPGVWHNTVIVFSAGTLVSLYTDGKMVFQVRLTGRPFSENDYLNQMILGNSGELPVALDEIMILNRPLMDEEIADYFQAINQMHLVGYPVEK